jgi:hypothetical protein
LSLLCTYRVRFVLAGSLRKESTWRTQAAANDPPAFCGNDLSAFEARTFSLGKGQVLEGKRTKWSKRIRVRRQPTPAVERFSGNLVAGSGLQWHGLADECRNVQWCWPLRMTASAVIRSATLTHIRGVDA